ncbi:AAA family ATPase [Labrys wisconsinensis]|uniref:Pilus assembly protein CpaE n=1 Tax=Labrys wisconsinensis TaxID=425677 RepID=A0ABU0JG06_9HYPH|nr:CpaE family protein [Labrys wisconsinensis]MDQ0472411.1 pilus assembly protein CpaE [Labrys wisconsinensis]
MSTGTHSSHAPGDAQIVPLPRVSLQAFCETSDLAQVVQTAAADRRMDKAHVKIQMGGVAAAAEAYRAAPTPNVILIENTQTRDELIAGLDRLAEFCDPGTKVVIIGHINDVLLYRELMRRGISEYIIAPVGPLALVRSLSDLFHTPGSDPVGRTLAFVGAKGGVGASTVCHNVAWAVAKTVGQDAVIVDMDLPFGTAGLDFNQDPPQGIADIVFAPDRVDSGLVDRLLSKCTDHLSLLAAPSTLERPYDVGEDGFDAVLDILRASVPSVVLDVPHVWSAWSRRVLASADQIVIVATPDLASLRNAKNLIDLMKQMRQHDAPPRLVLNMVGVPKRPEIKAADFAKNLETDLIAAIPFEPALFGTASNNGQMIAEISGGSKPAELFVSIAQHVSGRTEARRARRSLLAPIFSKLQRRKA